MEDRLNRKYCEQLRLEARIPTNLEGIHLHRMVAYEIMRLTFGQPFNRYAWVVNPPDTVQDYGSNINRILGAVFSAIVSKVTTLAENTKRSKKQIKELLSKINANIPGIAAYMRRHPESDALVTMDLEELLLVIEKEQFTDEEVHGREPWWFNKAAVKEHDFDNTEGGYFDLDSVIASIGPKLDDVSSEEDRQKVKAAMEKLFNIRDDEASVFAP